MRSRPSRVFKLTNFVALTLLCAFFAACKSSEDKTMVSPVLPGAEPSQGDFGNGMPDATSEGARADGVGSGGGGDVVVCYDQSGKIIDMESFDIWASQNTYNFVFDRAPLGFNEIDAPEIPYTEQVASTIETLRRADPAFASRLSAIAKAFWPSEIDGGQTINKVDYINLNGDSGAVIIPDYSEKCFRMTHERMFWQYDRPKAHQYPYQLVERLWTYAPERVKAAVVLHESIWKMERRIFNPESSVNSQYFNALIHSKQFKTYSAVEYYDALSKIVDRVGLKWSESDEFSVNYFGVILSTSRIEAMIDPTGVPTVTSMPSFVAVKAHLAYEQGFSVDGLRYRFGRFIELDQNFGVIRACIITEQTVSFNSGTVVFEPGTLVEFKRTGGQQAVPKKTPSSPLCINIGNGSKNALLQGVTEQLQMSPNALMRGVPDSNISVSK